MAAMKGGGNIGRWSKALPFGANLALYFDNPMTANAAAYIDPRDLPSSIRSIQVRERGPVAGAFGKGIDPEDRGIMSLADAGLLERYLSTVQARFERSVFGATLDRVAAGAALSKPCPKCCAKDNQYPGIILTPRRVTNLAGEPEVIEFGDYCPKCKGTAVVPAKLGRQRKAPRTGIRRCSKCRGLGHIIVECTRQPCPACRGDGYTAANVVFQTGCVGGSSHGYLPSHEALVEFGMASRRLQAVHRLNRVSYHALVLFYGDIGARWGREKQGRLFAVYALTRAGRALLRSADKLATHEITLDPTEHLGVIANVETTQPKESRRKLLDDAETQASAIYRVACHDWNATAPKKQPTRDGKSNDGQEHEDEDTQASDATG
jgi:hypothetical protein